MSRAAVKNDVERTAIMLDLIHRRYLTMEEVAPSTGGFSRLADVLVLDCWRSGGHALSGWEIKASRADLKKELSDPGKSAALSRYCDSWSLLVWGKFVYEGLEIPPTWGIFDVSESDDVYALEKVRAPARLKPEPWSRSFVASLVRNAFCQSPGERFLGRAAATAYREGLENGRARESTRWTSELRPLVKHLYGEEAWSHRDDSLEALVAEAIRLIPARADRITKAIDGVIGPVVKMP